MIVLCFLCPVVAWLGFGEQGVINLYHTEMERQAYVERIHQLTEENQAMFEEIDRLRTDMDYVEFVARKELNLIKENEVIYKFPNENTPEAATR